MRFVNLKYLYGLLTPPTCMNVRTPVIISIADSTLKAFFHPFRTCYICSTDSLVCIRSEPKVHLWVHYAYVITYIRM